ncbi:MAG: hypothetical protein FWF27_01470 [Candidatus Bathyarchaeota archaeon]|nr:hypothetical protein [Candidatus Termiticorpusculum sp.]
MNLNVKSKFGLRSASEKNVLFVSLLSMLLFVSLLSCSVLVVVGADAAVMDEPELNAAITSAPLGVSTVVTLGKDITLTGALSIISGKNITLVSDGTSEFKLVGVNDESTISVESGGILFLNGIVVTHVTNEVGSGVTVASGGNFTLLSGKIFGNTDADGGGVVNDGNFTMSGGAVLNNTGVMGGVVNNGNFTLSGNGVITNNTVIVDEDGDVYGGVLNTGVFRMSGGEISNNTACGVSNFGNFTMSGGKILKNIGNGVFINHDGNFTMTGGEISYNKAEFGGGVYIDSSFGVGTFIMSGGSILNNSATLYGGGVYNSGDCSFSMSSNAMIANNTASNGGGVYTVGAFTMSGGEISNNTVAAYGGGVYNYYGKFSMTNGKIVKNVAAIDGGGVFSYAGNFTVSGSSEISYNTANRNGGGIGVPGIEGLSYVYVREGVTFSNNRAATAYNRAPTHDALYDSRVSSNKWTSPFTQGYNNYDIYYISGTQVDPETGKPITSPSPSPTNSPSGTPRPPASTPPGSSPKDPSFNWFAVAIVLAIVVGLLVAVLFFYRPKKATKQVIEEDLSDFTVV